MEMIKIAAEVLHITCEEAEQNQKRLPEVNATYFWDKKKGGLAVIISDNGEKLTATSAVSPERHIDEFKKGHRN